MKVIQLSATAGADRTLHLALPVETAGGEYEVAVVLTPKPGVNGVSPDSPEARGWPKGYIEKTFGSISDESLFRHPQPQFEPIESVD